MRKKLKEVVEMKVGLLAYHNALNYGAVLQIASLQRKIKELGHDCEIINYYADGSLQWDKYQRPTFSMKFLSEMKWNTYLFFVRRRKRKNFDSFLSDLKMTEFISRENLWKLNNFFDVFIVGSDQVWNCFTMGEDATYFLDFVEEDKKKNAYAASFGYDVVPSKFVDFTIKYLSGFNYISVRETQGQQIIKKLVDRDVPVVLDPVFFMEKKDWKLNPKRIVDYKYILVYQPQKSTTLGKKARELAQKRGCKVVYISRTWDGVIGKNTINLSTVSPLDFLRLVRDAELIVTNSFHGTAFSIIFHKQFWVEYNDGTSSRMESILSLMDLKDRVLNNTLIEKEILIDYDRVDSKLYSLITCSESYLKQILNKKE